MPWPRTWTRRHFIWEVARRGGSAFAAMSALGLLVTPGTISLGRENSGSGRGKKILILGGGLAGMASAYELTKLGYECRILEVRQRAGGRCWTVRGGSKETEVGGVEQTCRFDDRYFMNPGPTRIPGHHRSTLNYCREFGVELEVFTNVNESAWVYAEGSPRMRMRAAKADYRGHTAELLAKAINQKALDLPLSPEDREKLITYLRKDGDLQATTLLYAGSKRRGYTTEPGAGLTPGVWEKELDLEALVKSGYGEIFPDYYSFDQQPTMLTPKGGVDQIAKAFEQRVGSMIIFGATVTEIRKDAESGVTISFRNSAGTIEQASADYCICTIPLAVLKDIPADFSPEFSRAIAGVSYFPTGKIGLQFKRRFWEEDDRIFGGISRTTQNITQIIYPFDHYNGRKGVLIGYYNFGPDAEVMGRLDLPAREARALAEGAKIHPQYPAEFENSFSVAWQKIPYNLGGWAEWDDEARKSIYPILNEPDGPIYLAGEHLTYLGGWMAGAFESAHRVVESIHQKAAKI